MILISNPKSIQDSQISVLDSLGYYHEDIVKNIIKLFELSENILVNYLAVPIQTNLKDCGVHLLSNIEYIINIPEMFISKCIPDANCLKNMNDNISSKRIQITNLIICTEDMKKEKKYKCEKCNKSFYNKKHLKRHINNVHQNSNNSKNQNTSVKNSNKTY